MFLPQSLKQELEEKRAAIADTPKGRLRLHKKVHSSQFLEAQIHTARGEMPVAELHYRPSIQKTNLFCRVFRGIKEAWTYGLIAYPTEGLNEDFLKQIAWYMDPEFFQGETAYFRRPGSITSVVSAWQHVAPDPLEIQDQLCRWIFMNDELKNLSEPEKAFWYNMQIARIQPFPDCNKRTGKTIQNLHLNLYCYPPAIIKEGESEFYNRLLGEAIQGFKEREGKGHPSRKEARFFTYLGTRVNIAFDEILDLGKPVSGNLRRAMSKY